VAGGVAITLTLDTGVSEAFTGPVGKIAISHGRMKAAVGMNFSGKNNSDVVETWATS
jgi:hypothetical protein